MHKRVLIFLLAAALGAYGQTDIGPTPGATASTPRPEPAIASFSRVNADAVSLALPGAAAPLLLHDFDFNGEPIPSSKLHLRQLAPGVYELTSLAYEVGYWHFELADDPTGVYGTGERYDTLNHAHTTVRNVSLDNAGPKGSGTYKPMPFFLSNTGYGLWLDTTGEATFDFNSSSRTDIRVDLPASHLRLVLFTGTGEGKGRFADMLGAFAKLAGPVTLPPYWAFAPWQARDFHRSEAEVLEDVDRTRALGLPASVILIDSPWATAYNSYQFNPKQFDDAPAMVKHLHGSGYKLVLWHTSWINSKSDPPKEDGFADKILETSPNYAEAAENNYFLRSPDGTPYVAQWWKGKGSLIDFTNPKAKLWWQDQVRQAIAAGADGFKDDDAEGNFQGLDGQVKFADGTDPRLMRNRYAVLYNNAIEELIQKDLKGNGVLFARSVSTGANGIGFLWGGDNEADFSTDNGLPSVVTAGLGAGISGMPLWAADLGGYFKQGDTPNALLLQRWTEYAAFSPVMEVMSTANIVPWTFDANSPAGTTPALDTYRKFAVLHMSLFPYRYAAAQEAQATGMPLLRPLVLEYQDDVKVRSMRNEYLFGPDLLVAPVLDESSERTVYLPAGDWLNLFTGAPEAGGRTVIAHAEANQIPVYARKGTILPKIPEDVMTLVPEAESGNKDVKTLTAETPRIYELLGPAAATPTTITDFEHRTVTRAENTLLIEGQAATVMIRWRFQTPKAVTVNGAAVQVKPDAEGVATLTVAHKERTTVLWH